MMTALSTPTRSERAERTGRMPRFSDGMNDTTYGAWTLFGEALDWLRDHYGQFEFWVERDLVWTVQTRLDVRAASPHHG